MLTKEQLHSIELLQKECEQADDVQLKLNWEMLRFRDDSSLDFFHEEDGELVGYLALYAFGSTVEVCGMVKPSERRKNHFSTLWQEAVKMIRTKGFRNILLNAPASSTSAKAWLSNQSCKYEFSEFQMRWKERSLEKCNDIHLRNSEPTDSELEIQLDVLAFNLTVEDAREHQEQIKKSKNQNQFIIEVDMNPIGKIGVTRTTGKAYISGFSVLPAFQGKGFGRKALRNIVKQEYDAGYSIHLEVETKNNHALDLYESIGFITVQGQDYYSWN